MEVLMNNNLQAQVKTIIETAAKYKFNIVATSDTIISVLDLAPLKGGSVWGTDGGSIGGAVALQNGQFVMNKSGSGGVRFMRELRKQLGQ
jgi:hypothetical protein